MYYDEVATFCRFGYPPPQRSAALDFVTKRMIPEPVTCVIMFSSFTGVALSRNTTSCVIALAREPERT